LAVRDKDYSLGTVPPVDYEPGKPPEGAGLTFLADFYKTDKGTIKHLYTPVYEEYFKLLRDKPISLLEVGVASGCSLKMWSAYFPKGKIVGIDNRKECAEMCKGYGRITITICDSRYVNFKELFDIIIDDGSHISADIVANYFALWPKLKSGGLYFIEDTNCTSNPGYINVFNGTRDARDFESINYTHWLDTMKQEMDAGYSRISSINEYGQLLVLKKK